MISVFLRYVIKKKKRNRRHCVRRFRIYPLVAQPDNAADSDSEDRGFESLRAGQEISRLTEAGDFFFKKGFEGRADEKALHRKCFFNEIHPLGG